jgi:signal transduction histidine kinase
MSATPLQSSDLAVDTGIGSPCAGPPAERANPIEMHPTELKMADKPNASSDISTNGQTKTRTRARVESLGDPRLDRRRAALLDLRRLEGLFADVEWPERRAFMRARKLARERALEVLDRSGSGADGSRAALLIAASELFGAMRTELAASPQDALRLAEGLEDVIGLPRIALAREVLRAPELLSLLPAIAIEVQLAMLVAFGPLRSASLWTLDDAEQVTCVRHVGESGPSRGAKEMAGQLLGGNSAEPGARRLLLGLPVGRWQQPLAALVGTARPGIRDGCEAFLAEAVPMLGAVLERDALLAGNAASERALVQSSERKLTRLGFDLHDGPIQDVTVLGEDLRLLRGQIDVVVRNAKDRRLLGGSLDDLNTQLLALDTELRRISNEVHAASVLLNRPLGRALRDVTQAFAARTNVEPRLTLDGDMSLLSVSQQIALLNIVHEALTNVREHSDATEVEVAVSVNEEGVEAQIIDNGHGFDLEPTLIRAARRGRLGLVAMHERVRLLGGQCRIDSRPGGPTVVSIALERWEPLIQDSQSSRIPA